MMAAVLQLSVVRSVLFFVLLVLWTDEKYDYGDVSGFACLLWGWLRYPDARNDQILACDQVKQQWFLSNLKSGFLLQVDPNLYVNAIIGASTFISFYGCLLFYKATKSSLHGYGLRAKFICIILVLVLCGLQSGILETMGAVEVIPCIPPLSVVTRSQCRSRRARPLLFPLFLSLFHLRCSFCHLLVHELVSSPSTVIYHYCVIVEMFCIGLYARHTFRKVEPSLEAAEGPIRMCQADKAAQTDGHVTQNKLQLLSEEARPGGRHSGASNLTFTSAEDTLCRIEHAPLHGFCFPQATPKEHGSTEEPGTELTRFTIRAEMNHHSNSSDITVV